MTTEQDTLAALRAGNRKMERLVDLALAMDEKLDQALDRLGEHDARLAVLEAAG